MKSFKALLLTAVLALVLVSAGCGGKEAEKAKPQQASDGDKIKVGFMYVGPVGDAGWTYAQEQGRLYLEKEMPNVITTKVESVKEGADAERVLTQLAQENKIVFATSFGYMDSVIKVAEKFPNVIFMHCSGYKTAPNAGTYFGRMYQARYLSGMVAGKMTKANTIGYVAAYPIPEVIRGIDAFTLGVRSVNPDAKVKVMWTMTWLDPPKEKDAGKALLDAGADIIAQHQDTPGPQQAAEERGKYSIGYNSDMSKIAPKAVLTSPVWNWGPYYVDTVKKVKEGKWKNDQYWGSMAEKIVDLAPYGPMVPEDVKKLVDAEKQDIISGKFDVFWGPVKDQQGQVRVAEGQKMSDEDMLKLNWFVQGVDGNIPAQ
ncbi:MAG: BMP family ABC transporter substrate-binding protein [Eubacteriales bacterium]